MVGADRVSMSVQARRRVPGLRQTMEQPLPQVRAGIVLGGRHAPAGASSRAWRRRVTGAAQRGRGTAVKPAAPGDGPGHAGRSGRAPDQEPAPPAVAEPLAEGAPTSPCGRAVGARRARGSRPPPPSQGAGGAAR